MKKSAGLLLYRIKNKNPEVFLVHPGGPYWVRKEIGAWSIPKGEIEDGEDPFLAAIREMKEETGITIHIPQENFFQLAEVKQKSGKIVIAWAAETDFNIEEIKSNMFEMEWPPKSGKNQWFPEVDKGNWFSIENAQEKILVGQTPLLKELHEKLINLPNREI